MRIITSTSNNVQVEVTARERAVAEKIMKDPNVEVQVGKHMDCHNRFKSKAMRELEEKIENRRAKLEALEKELEELEDEQYLLEDTWTEKWEKRHENIMMCVINKMAHKLLKGVTICVGI